MLHKLFITYENFIQFPGKKPVCEGTAEMTVYIDAKFTDLNETIEKHFLKSRKVNRPILQTPFLKYRELVQIQKLETIPGIIIPS